MFPDGNIEQLLGEEDISNGVQGYNSTSINVAYVGGIDSKGRPTDNRTKAQKKSLAVLLTTIKRDYPQAHIMGHRDIWGKDKSKWKKMCPCFDAEAEYKHLDDAPIGKYDDAIEEFNNEPEEVTETTSSSYSPEYILDKPRDYTGFLKSLRPW